MLQIERIKNQKISPDGKSKVQIQLQMNDGKAHAFHFTDNTPPGKAKELRNKVKIHLSKLLGKVTTKKVDKEGSQLLIDINGLFEQRLLKP